MSQFLSALIASVTILTVILLTDIGSRKVTRMRMIRSVIAVGIIVAIFVRSFPTQGNDVSLQLVGIGAGVICGLLAGSLLPVFRHESGDIYSKGGIAYAAVWVVLAVGRILFAYGAENWFPEDIARFSIENKISGADVYANTFVFMALAMVLTRTAVLLVKMRRVRQTETAAGLDPESPLPVSNNR